MRGGRIGEGRRDHLEKGDERRKGQGERETGWEDGGQRMQRKGGGAWAVVKQ